MKEGVLQKGDFNSCDNRVTLIRTGLKCAALIVVVLIENHYLKPVFGSWIASNNCPEYHFPEYANPGNKISHMKGSK